MGLGLAVRLGACLHSRQQLPCLDDDLSPLKLVFLQLIVHWSRSLFYFVAILIVRALWGYHVHHAYTADASSVMLLIFFATLSFNLPRMGWKLGCSAR
eukprot:3334024-Amphidinium_carterae.1